MCPRIASELRAQIVSGELPLGAQLPTHSNSPNSTAYQSARLIA
jgi:DNA-binding transcriptional regulator YhcF (GntR family)